MNFQRVEEVRFVVPTTLAPDPAQHHDVESEHLDEEHHSWSEKAWPILAILAPICIMGFLSNAAVVWIFVKWRVLRDRINVFVVNLAVSNLAICVAGPPLIALPIFLAHTAETPEQEIITDLVYRISACLFGLSCYANSFATTAIALHRRRMILKSRAQMHHERPQIAVCLVMWGLSLLLAIPELFRCATVEEDHNDEADMTLPTLLGPFQRLALEIGRVTLQFLLVSALMIFSYVSVFVALRKRSIIRQQFQRDKSLRAHAQRLSSIHFKKPELMMAKNSNNNIRDANGTANGGKTNDNNNNNDQRKKSSRRPTLTGSCVTAAAASAAATVTTVVATGSLVNGQMQSASFDTVEYVMTSGPAANGEGVSPKMSGAGLRSKMPSKMKHVWNSIRSKKFSASDSKNVCILVATIAVHFACWSPYNAVRLYVAIIEAINNHEEPRAPIAEGIVLCIAVSSVLHCPLFYTWFNRRNRQGLIACCAAIIPCRNSLLRRRLKELAHKGNSHRYRLPIPIDTPPARTPRRASRLQHALLRRHSTTSFAAELRQILYNAQHRHSTSSQEGPPPARHNSYMSDGCQSVTASDNEFESQPVFFPDPSTILLPTLASSTMSSPPSMLLLNNRNGVLSILSNAQKMNNDDDNTQQDIINTGNNNNSNNNNNGGDDKHSPVREMFSTELFEKAINELARKVSDATSLSRSNSTLSNKRASICVSVKGGDDGGLSKKDLFDILLFEPSETEQRDPAAQKLHEEIITRTVENLHELKLRRALSSRPVRRKVQFENNGLPGNPKGNGNLRRHKTVIKKPSTAGQFLTVPEKYPQILSVN